MAVLGRLLVSSAERLDLPDLLSVDSYSGGDWKYFVRSLVGDSSPYILKGFDVIDPQNAIGTQSCSIRVADSVVYHPSSNSGSFFHGLEEGNANALPLVPELRKNAVNYVYLTFSTFNTSIDTRAFWDPDKDGGVGGEFTQDVNTEAVLKVDINVSTGSFPANTIPVAKITVGPVVITAIEDARDLMFRLGTGGISPDPFSRYNFRSLPSSPYQRSEPPTTMTSPSDPNPFQGADKNILTLKEWMDVVMTKLAELGGSTFWYEDASTTSIISNFVDALATSFKSKGQWIHDSSTPGLVTWTEDIVVKTTQDTRDTIIRAGSKTLANEQVMYVPLVRNQPFNGSDQVVQFVNGQNYINTVGGSLGLFANLRKGDWVKKITDQNHVYLQVQEFYDTINLGGSVTTASNARSIRLNGNYLGSTGTEKGRFDRGEYLASDVVVSDRDDSALSVAGGNFHWMAIRSDTIENIGSVQSFTLSGTLSEPDGQTAKVSVTTHGLSDGDRIIVSAPAAQAGTYVVEVEDVDTFYIQTTNMTTGAFTAHYGLVTTAARTNGYGLQLESANHGFDSGETVILAGTTNYNGSYVVNKRSGTIVQFPFASAVATETAGTATLSRVNVRAEQGIIKLIQGETADIGELETKNIKSFIGMNSIAETYPLYAIPSGHNMLQGMQNYNSLSTDSLTTRVSRLTAMMADKAQDKVIKAIASDIDFIKNTSGITQEITFLPAGSTLTFTEPGSSGNAVVSLPSASTGIVLDENQVAYILLNRNTASTPSILISDIDTAPINENMFVVALRLTGSDVYLWDGSLWKSGLTPTTSLRMHQDLGMKLVEGGTWSFDLASGDVSWGTSAYIQIPGVALNRNELPTGSFTLNADGDAAYVEVNRDNSIGPASIAPTLAVTTIDAVPEGANIFVIAIRDGNDVIVGDSMRLIDGESKKLYAGTSDQTLTYIGAPNEASSSPSYSSQVFITNGDSLTTAIGKLDAHATGQQTVVNEDRSIELISGGTWAWNATTNTLNWSSQANIAVPGFADSVNVISAGSATLTDGQVAYVEINRTGPGGTLTVNVAAENAVVVDDNTVVIARRVGSVVYVGLNGPMLLQDGESKELGAGLSVQNRTYLGIPNEVTTSPAWNTSHSAPLRTIPANTTDVTSAVASIDSELDKFFGQFRIKPHPTLVNRVIVTGVDFTMLDNAILSQTLSNLIVNFTGSQIDFTTGTVYQSDGVTPLGINFTPFSIPSSQYFWYSINAVASTVGSDNRISVQMLVLPATAANATPSSAPLAAFASSGKNIGQVLLQNIGGTITLTTIRQLGVGSGSGGSGTGNVTDIQTRMEMKLADSKYELATINDFLVDAQNLVSSATASYDTANSRYKFTAISQNIVSINLLDVNEFLTQGVDVGEAEVDLFYLYGKVDKTPTVELSRDGGNNYYPVTMTRLGTTDEFNGRLQITTEEASFATLHTYAFANADSTLDLTGSSSGQARSQVFTVSSAEVVKTIQLQINKVGSPTGTITLQIVKDNAGVPSLLAQDLVAASAPVQASSISAGTNTFTFNLTQALPVGTYHVVVVSDATYKASYSVGVTSLGLRADGSSPTAPVSNQYNGSTWAATTSAIVYIITGRTLDMRLRITSSATSNWDDPTQAVLLGFGVSYNPTISNITTGIDALEVQQVNGNSNTNTFTLTKFLPDWRFLRVYVNETGQVFKYGAFSLNGFQVVFPTNSFNTPNQTYTLTFDQLVGGGFDNSDSNAAIIAANHLGSSDGTIDRSLAGRGIILRRPDGTLREITIDNSDNIAVYSVP